MLAFFRIFVLLALALPSAHAFDPADFSPGMETTARGKYRLVFPSAGTDSYYVLFRSHSPGAIGRPVAITLGNSANLPMTLADSAIPQRVGFYRILQVPVSSPLDLDADGFSDYAELLAPTTQNALNPGPALALNVGSKILESRARFDALAHRDDFPGAQDVREVKFVITDLETDHPRLHFADSNRFEYHYDFTRTGLGRYTQYSYNTGLSRFNNETYFTNTNRKNMAGSLIAHDNYVGPDGNQGLFTIEFWPTDPVAFRFVETAFEMIAAGMPFVDGNIAYHPAGETQRSLMAEEASEYEKSYVNRIATEDLFANVTYTALNQGEGYGRLRIPEASETLAIRDVVLFRTLPNDLTHVSGIISEVPQTPLSHINLKAVQNKTPNAYIKDASTNPRIAPLIGENVYYRVLPDGFEIRSATQAEVDTWFDTIRPTVPQFPVRNLTVTTIQPLASIRFANADAFGSKAANVGELHNLMPETAPNEGFGVPFYFYDEFMKYNGYYAQVQALLDDPLFQSDEQVRESSLAAFRRRIEKDSLLPPWMLNDLAAMQGQFPAGTPIRCRSSTNNEDLAGFNGAGLYDSHTHRPDEGHIAKTMRQVWAALWNYRAFEEREFYRIDHFSAAMGVLVHPNYDDELANGVAVTKNIYNPGWEGYYVNVQAGENLVTNPGEEAIPEEFLVADLFIGARDYEIQYIRFSNQIPVGQRVLTRPQVLDLVEKMRAINTRFRPLYGNPSGFAMEIEFKITAEGTLAIKQARPWLE
jgi:pyruvate,water dikinase